MNLLKNVKKSSKITSGLSFVFLISASLTALSGSSQNSLVHDVDSSRVVGYRVINIESSRLVPDPLISSAAESRDVKKTEHSSIVVWPENIESIPENISDFLDISQNQHHSCVSVDCFEKELPHNIERDGGAALVKEQMIVKIMDRFRINRSQAKEIVVVAHQEAAQSGMDPIMILSIIATESSFNPSAFNKSGATGLMQAIPRYHHDKMKRMGIRHSDLTQIRSNIRLGSAILKEYLRLSNGNMTMALQKYNGNTKDPRRRYSNKVFQHYRWLSS